MSIAHTEGTTPSLPGMAVSHHIDANAKQTTTRKSVDASLLTEDPARKSTRTYGSNVRGVKPVMRQRYTG